MIRNRRPRARRRNLRARGAVARIGCEQNAADYSAARARQRKSAFNRHPAWTVQGAEVPCRLAWRSFSWGGALGLSFGPWSGGGRRCPTSGGAGEPRAPTSATGSSPRGHPRRDPGRHRGGGGGPGRPGRGPPNAESIVPSSRAAAPSRDNGGSAGPGDHLLGDLLGYGRIGSSTAAALAVPRRPPFVDAGGRLSSVRLHPVNECFAPLPSGAVRADSASHPEW